MPSVKNPNGPSKNRLAARAASARKKSQRQSAAGRPSRIDKADRTRGAGGGLLPTSGPNRALSAKKQRKVDRAAHHALQRKLAKEGEVQMKDAAPVEESSDAADARAVEEQLNMDIENIS